MPENMVRVNIYLDTSGLDLLDSNIQNIVDESARETVGKIKEDIIENWSPFSPSDPNTPPAKVTEYLEESIKVLRKGAGGRFASAAQATQWAIYIEAEYGAALEFGYPPRNLAPRPFLRPAVNRAHDLLGALIRSKLAFITARRLTGAKGEWMRVKGLL